MIFVFLFDFSGNDFGYDFGFWGMILGMIMGIRVGVALFKFFDFWGGYDSSGGRISNRQGEGMIFIFRA